MKYSGLTHKEAQQKLAREGYNELPVAKKRSFLKIALEVAREPMFILLVACGLIYLAIGDIHEALFLLAFVFLIMGITIFQENKTEKTLEALRDLSSPRALVIRDGHQIRIAGREIVREDILILEEGDRVPADAYILEANDLLLDESLLTGESVSVRKKIWEGEDFAVAPGGEDLPFVYSGTMVVTGQGLAKVFATGTYTQLGKIGKSIERLKTEETPLQKQTLSLVKKIAFWCVVVCLLVFLLYTLRFGNWLNGLLAGLTLAMSILPEEIPVILTIFLALGAWRISQRKVLTRRIPAIETLGATTVLCVDKTGTLTINQMSVKNLLSDQPVEEISHENAKNLSPKSQELISYSILSSEIIPLDPMEKAFHKLGLAAIGDFNNFYENFNLIKEYSLSRQLLATTHLWQSKNQDKFLVASKGAPEAIFELCHLDEDRQKELEKQVEILAARGQRVLGVAKGFFEGERVPETHHDFNFEFLGLMGLADPPRPQIEKSIMECHQAGLRVVMITGDYPVTAQAIGHQIGIKNPDQSITGTQLEIMSAEELKEKIKDINIFARVIPEQKLRLVEALKSNNEVVAMTGDGVNDAPALKAAHIGISMGERGTDVAREASSLVLLDDSFAAIVDAIRMGRRIFDNIKKAIAYTFAVHIPIAGLAFFPLLFKWPLVFWPVHIVFLELIIDPSCSFVFEMEPEESDIMKRPPRNPQAPLFSRGTIFLSVAQGLSVLVFLLILYGLSLKMGLGELKSRAVVFSALIISNLGLIANNSSWERGLLKSLTIINRSFWVIAGAAIGFLALVLYSPLSSFFRLTSLNLREIFLVLVFAAAGVFFSEGFKILKNYLD